MNTVRRALISVSDKTGVVEFAQGLQKQFGFMLVSTGGTEKTLKTAKLDVMAVSAFTNFPEMMNGRLKTLHPVVHGGILARRDNADDMASASRHGIPMWDIVAVNLYPFAKTAAKEDVRFNELIEEIDIGGPTMVRAAAKNFGHVLVVIDPLDYPKVLEALGSPEGPSLELRFELARKAFAHTADYDATICDTLYGYQVWGDDEIDKAPAVC